MSSTQPKPKQPSRWGSLLSGAVAGLESRLDTILADDNEASAKSRAAEAALLEAKIASAKEQAANYANAGATSNRSPSRKPNDRLQERLAKASGSRSVSQAVSEAGSPKLPTSPLVNEDTPRTSLSSRPSLDLSRTAEKSAASESGLEDLGISNGPETAVQPAVMVSETPTADAVLADSALPINPASHTQNEVANGEVPPSVDAASNEIDQSSALNQTSADLHTQLVQLHVEREEADKKRQEEMDMVLERVDALQAKLAYLAKESLVAAKEANGTSGIGSAQQVLAEKDEKIALLMEEGLALSKTEMRHLATIRKLNTRTAADERVMAELRRDVSRLKSAELTSRTRINQLAQIEREHSGRLARLQQAESDLSSQKLESEARQNTILSLRKRLEVADRRLETLETEAHNSSLQADTKKIADLEEALSTLRIEKQLAADKAKAEQQALLKELESLKVAAQASQLETQSEISNLEARLEASRLRAEEVTSDQAGESQAKLLRQIETAQTQYTLAAENWRSIEASLNARLSTIEKERDDTIKREGELRKKARDLTLRCRKLEEELDSGAEKTSNLSGELLNQKTTVKKLEAKLEAAEKAHRDAQDSFEQQRRTLEAGFATRLEEERSRTVSASASVTQRSKRNSSPTSTHRKTSTIENFFSGPIRRPLSRGQTNDSTTSLSLYDARSRRSSNLLYNDRLLASPTLSTSQRLSQLSLTNLSTDPNSIIPDTPETPSIITDAPASDTDGDDASIRGSSPHATAADVLSATTVHTGPSVQLVERMSSSIRRLEAEKAAHRDELARITAQRDESRTQLVALMREAETARDQTLKVDELEKGMGELRTRYDACLEMLGEREEERDELREELGDMRRIYKELVGKMGGAS